VRNQPSGERRSGTEIGISNPLDVTAVTGNEYALPWVARRQRGRNQHSGERHGGSDRNKHTDEPRGGNVRGIGTPASGEAEPG